MTGTNNWEGWTNEEQLTVGGLQDQEDQDVQEVRSD